MPTLSDRIAALERTARHEANRDTRPWDVIFSESLAELTKEVDGFLAPFGGDAGAFLDNAERTNNEGLCRFSD